MGGSWLAAVPDANPWPLIGTFSGLLVLAVVWAWWRGRSAPRTIANWAGEGIRDDLGPAHASVLLGMEPGVTVAVALEPHLASGAARIRAIGPVELAWDTRPDDPIARVAGEDGRLDFDGVCALLETLHAELEDLLAPWSGRQTAVHFRSAVHDRWRRVLVGDPVTLEDRPWLLLHDPRRVWDRIPDGRDGELLRDLVRLGGLLACAVPRDLCASRAAEARSGYFAFRPDLRRRRKATPLVDPVTRVPRLTMIRVEG